MDPIQCGYTGADGRRVRRHCGLVALGPAARSSLRNGEQHVYRLHAAFMLEEPKASFDFLVAGPQTFFAVDILIDHVATDAAAVLCRDRDAHKFVRRDELEAVALLDALVQRIAVVRTVADHSLGNFPQEALVERGFDEFCLLRRSAGQVHGERKTMAVCDCHDFAAFAAFCRADTRAPFFAELKLA
jgi:hypothetical protein